MGSKTAFFTAGREALRSIAGIDPTERATAAFLRRLWPECRPALLGQTTLGSGIYPPDRIANAAVYEGLSICCHQDFASDRPALLEPWLSPLGTETARLHAMHSGVDWLAFAVWEDGRLIRALSLSPEEGVIEEIGEPFPFETGYWSGEYPGPSGYALPFHPLDLGQEALASLFGFILEGRPRPDLVDAEEVSLLSFRLDD